MQPYDPYYGVGRAYHIYIMYCAPKFSLVVAEMIVYILVREATVGATHTQSSLSRCGSVSSLPEDSANRCALVGTGTRFYIKTLTDFLVATSSRQRMLKFRLMERT